MANNQATCHDQMKKLTRVEFMESEGADRQHGKLLEEKLKLDTEDYVVLADADQEFLVPDVKDENLENPLENREALGEAIEEEFSKDAEFLGFFIENGLVVEKVDSYCMFQAIRIGLVPRKKSGSCHNERYGRVGKGTPRTQSEPEVKLDNDGHECPRILADNESSGGNGEVDNTTSKSEASTGDKQDKWSCIRCNLV